MAIKKRHHGTLGDLSGMEAPDLSFQESVRHIVSQPAAEPETDKTLSEPQPTPPAPEVATAPAPQPQPLIATPAEPAEPVVITPIVAAEPVVAPQPVVEPQPVVAPQPVVVATEPVAVPEKRRGRPKGIKGAGPKRLNLIQGDTDKVLALQLPSKLIEGLRRYADEHDMTMKELIGKTLMKRIGPEYYS